MKKFYNIILLALFVSLLYGCGKKLPEGFPKTFSCSITITKDGKPLDNAMVLFTPESGSGGAWAIGAITDAQGVAEIHTTVTGYSQKGAPLGKYKVTVSKDLPPLEDADAGKAMSYEETLAHNAKLAEKAAKRLPIVPKKYSDVSQTPLKVEIKPDTPIEETFDVEK
ncbi:MAG: hypothetical protein LBJ67_06285 [Planctomycetaceae bacterium]|jgi:hypothetical protein|nr:hypothetical protein [Planctomycetaceae bacterium]